MPRVYAETTSQAESRAKDTGGEPHNYRDNWFRREPDFDRADFEAFCTIMDTIMKPTKERIFTPSFVPALLRFKP